MSEERKYTDPRSFLAKVQSCSDWESYKDFVEEEIEKEGDQYQYQDLIEDIALAGLTLSVFFEIQFNAHEIIYKKTDLVVLLSISESNFQKTIDFYVHVGLLEESEDAKGVILYKVISKETLKSLQIVVDDYEANHQNNS